MIIWQRRLNNDIVKLNSDMMKRNALVFLITAFILFAGINFAKAQDQPAPKKDTVNMDTYAKPKFYNAEEDAPEGKGGRPVSAILMVGAVLLIGATAYLLVKKKK